MTRGINMAPGSPLADLLLESDMSQTELARRSGVSREAICRLCRGATTSRLTVIVALAWALDLDPLALVDLYDGDVHDWPLGPRSVDPTPPAGYVDWVVELRAGRDPHVLRCVETR